MREDRAKARHVEFE
jgi:hypothetical protein